MRKKSLVLADSSKWYLRPRLSRHANHPHLYCANQKWAQNSEQFAVTIQYFGPCGGTHLWKQWKSGAHASPPSLAIAHSTRTKRSIYLLIMYVFIYLFISCRDIYTVKFLYFWHYYCWHVECLFSIKHECLSLKEITL